MTKCNEFSKFTVASLDCKLLVWSHFGVVQFWLMLYHKFGKKELFWLVNVLETWFWAQNARHRQGTINKWNFIFGHF